MACMKFDCETRMEIRKGSLLTYISQSIASYVVQSIYPSFL